VLTAVSPHCGALTTALAFSHPCVKCCSLPGIMLSAARRPCRFQLRGLSLTPGLPGGAAACGCRARRAGADCGGLELMPCASVAMTDCCGGVDPGLVSQPCVLGVDRHALLNSSYNLVLCAYFGSSFCPFIPSLMRSSATCPGDWAVTALWGLAL